MYTPAAGLISNEEFLFRLGEYEIVKDNKKIEWLNVPAAFDIETTSFYDHEEKRAVMYIWQFGIDNLVTTGRTWAQFLSLLTAVQLVLDLDETRRLVVYVHNLPYEFQFIRKRIDWDEVFLMDDRKPVYCRTKGVVFKCSMKLSGGKALRTVGNDLLTYKVEKRDGDLDYSVIRSPLTPLSERELGYCENDIRVILHYIAEKIESDGNITKIPLTNTGYVRDKCRKACLKDEKNYFRYRRLMNNLTIDPDEYQQLKRGFKGGFTHANAHFVGQILTSISSHDLRSSYPTVMLLEKFPMSKAVKVSEQIPYDELKDMMAVYCCLFELEIWHVSPRLHQDHPISSSKCYVKEGVIEDNGRVVFADHLKMTITEQDYMTYSEFYDWDDFTISDMRIYRKGYLPTPIVKTILDFYEAKTSLKGVEGKAHLYMISKNMINAAFGMMVTDIVRDEFEYVNDMYSPVKLDLQKSIDKYNRNKKRFLFYPWGVWVTAYARANLFSGIIEFGSDYIYSDTDSIKGKNCDAHEEYFKRYEQGIREKISKAAAYHKIDESRFSPATPKGKIQTIGLWDDEGVYDAFKTLGAKRYLVSKDGELEITTAGVNKKKATEYLEMTGNPFENFKDGLTIPVEYSGRNVLTYIDEETEGTMVDCNGVSYNYHELSSVHMEGTQYEMSLSGQFIKYLKGVINWDE